ncbi:insulinase family protein [Amycolatopsis methanolica]|uniref:Peptidase M16 domain-containing protein n=1 Tax=Amycolatopsis methanolica 239 TaxID=1068978 RepID=A0A076ML25_AMYME|nr:insulinase family protein [Amycolatopsis methanolica]AIJ21454.1 peptidase M16 domain-containing protein [Amycolatopsis methanolica 239]
MLTPPAPPSLPEVHRAEIDGVPVFWTDQPGRLSASLLFGVGLAHESFLQTGITHLVEHLAMRRVRTSRYENNASTEVLHTSFDVTSTPETVAEHLRRVCESLADLDTGPLRLERGVLLAEERGNDGPGVTAWLPSALWFGNRAFGLTGNVQLAAVHAGPEQAREWCARWFHCGNASLVLSGPPPAGLKLPLPAGPPRQPVTAEPFDLPTPAQTSIPNGVVGCALVEWTAEIACAAGILIHRLTDRLQHLEGLVYDIAFDHQMVDARRAVLGFGTDVPDKQAARVVDAIRTELAELGRSGPTEEELAVDRAGLAEEVAERDFAVYRAFDAAMSELTGWPSAAEHQQRVLAGLDPAAVAAAARELAGGLVLCAPERHVPRDLPELPGSPLPAPPGREMKRALVGSTAPRGYRLVVGEEGLSTYFGQNPSPAAVVRFDDLAGVGIEHTDGQLPILHLFGTHGGAITVRPGDWRGGRALVRDLRARIDSAVCFEAPEAMRLFEQS